MRIHTDTIAYTQTLRDALYQTTRGVVLQECNRGKSRSHAYAYDVALQSDGTPDRWGTSRRRTRANGERYAASYDDWGFWLAALFELDPTMKAGPYTGRADFHVQTRGKYRASVTA